ncbi:hypothetical protein ACIOWE_03370 [Pseudomonas sp. NPDC087598]|uniref:hypothetical protein n=1 Tax=Pseudomonas sp. NPDC087598 TaxID=3364440 RepID=UPI0037F3A099
MPNIVLELADLWSETELRPFLGEVKRRHGVVETLALPSMRDLPPVQIETLFVPPLLAHAPVSADSDPELWPDGRTLLAELQDFKQLVVLGDPGGGKTTLSNWLAWRLAAGLTSPLPEMLRNRIPIPCVLREMPVDIFRQTVSVEELACSVADKLLGGLATTSMKQALVRRVRAGGYVLILDGIDEIPLPHRGTVSRWIRQAYEHEGCVLATSRIVGYEDGPVDCPLVSPSPSGSKRGSAKKSDGAIYGVFEGIIEEVYKYTHDLSTSKGSDSREPSRWAHVRYLMPFDQGRIASFSENWYRQRCVTEQEARQKTTDLLAALSQSEVTQKLARTPNLLSLMAIVHRERAHLPDGKALLYEEIANAYINTIDKQRKIAPGDVLAQYGWNDRKAWLAYVGFMMQSARSHLSNQDTGILAEEADVEQWLTDAMIVSGVPSPHEAAKIFLNWVARRSGLLLPRGEARYAFVHLSFQEYFCACYLDSCIVRPAFIRDSLPIEADVTRKKLVLWSEEPYWLETLVFLFELLSAERASEWVDDLAYIIFGNHMERIVLFSQSSELAARILKNKHIKISGDVKGGLATGLGAQAIGEWKDEDFNGDSGALSALLDTGYALAVVGENRDASELIDKIYLSKVVAHLEDVTAPDKVRVLIIEGVQSISYDLLEAYVNVRYLLVKNSNVESSDFLKKFRNMRVLHLFSLPLKDVEPVVGFDELQHVKLHNMPLADLSPIAALKGIVTLELHGLAVSDLNPVSKLKKINYLSLNNILVNDLSPLVGLKNLHTLFLDELPGVDLEPVACLKKLDYLKVADLPIKDFSFALNMKKLTTLDLRRLPITDYTDVGNMKWLRCIYVVGCRGKNLDALKNLSELSVLGVMGMPVTNVDFVSYLKKVRTCYFADTHIKDLGPFGTMQGLYSLTVEQTVVPDVAPLRNCTNLVYLDIVTKSAVDVGPLKVLSNLRTFNIRSPSVINIESLSTIDKLQLKWEV